MTQLDILRTVITTKTVSITPLAVFLAALMVMSVVALGFLAPAAAVTGDDGELGTASIEGTTTDSTFSPLNYASNDGNNALVDTNGLLVAINDWRNDNIETGELLDVINLWRSGESLLEVSFEDQDSIGGDAVEVSEAFVSDDVAEEYIVAIENEDGEILSESGVLSGTETDIEISDLDLDVEVGDTEEDLTAVLHEVDDGDRGDTFTAEGDPITDTATVNVLLEGLFLFNDTETHLDAKIATGETANVTVGVNAVSEVDINGTITLEDDEDNEIEQREIGPAKDEELLVEEFELDASALETGENLTYTVEVETDETPEIVESREGIILVQGLSLSEQALGEDNGDDAIIVEEVYAEENQTIEVFDADEELVGSTELSEAAANDSVPVEVETDAGEHTASLLDEYDEEVTADDGDIYAAALTFSEQAYQSSTDELTVETADLLDGDANDTTFTVDVHPTDGEGDIIPDEAVGQSGNLTGENANVTVELDEELTASDDYVAMIHLGESAAPLDTDALLSASEGELSPVVDDAPVNIVEGETGELVAPESGERLTNITVSTTIEAAMVSPEDENEVDIEARYIFDGEQEDSETVTLEPGEDETVEFTFELPGSTTAGEEEVEHSIETDETEASANLTLENPIQAAVDYANMTGADTVDVEDGVYEESVTVDAENLTIESQEGADVTVDSGNETAFDLYEDGITIDGLTLVGEPGRLALVNAADLGDDDAYTLVNNAFESNSEATGVLVGSGELTAENNTFDSLTAGLGGIGVEGAQATVSITNNTFTDIEEDAIGVGQDGADGEIAYNDFDDNSEGVKIFESVDDEGVGDLSVNYNNFEGNNFGVENNASEEVDATLNWWGDMSGPSGEGPGLGDAVSESVDFEPWLDAPYPEGEPVMDRDWEVRNLDGDNEGDRGEMIQLNATVENNYQSVTEDEEPGREVEARHILRLSDGSNEELNAKNITVFPGDETRVNFTSQLPASEDFGDDPDAEHRIRVEGEFRGKDLNVSQGFGDVEGTVTASGETVLDETPGEGDGIENATVDVYAFQTDDSGNATANTTTDADGSYAFEDLPFGEHFVTVEAEDFVSQERVVVPETNGVATENFALDYDGGGALSGEIALDTADPSEDVEVTVEVEETGNSTTEVIEGENTTATYAFDPMAVNVDEGYTVTATASYYDGDVAENVTVDQGEETEDVNLSLERETGSVNGTVTASGETTIEDTPAPDEAIEDATVTVYGFTNDNASDEFLAVDVETDENGSYEIEDVPVTSASTHVVEVEADDFTTTKETEVEVESNETTTVDFALDYAEAGTFTGDVELDTVDPTEDVEVTVTVSEDNETVTEETVWVNGSADSTTYEIEDVPVSVDEAYDVTFEADTYAGDSFESTVDVGETVEEDVLLKRETGEIDGTVTASIDGASPDNLDPIGDGDAIENATVELYAFDDNTTVTPVASTETDEDGAYAFEDVPVTTESEHFVFASATGFPGDGENATVAMNETTTVDLELDADAVEIVGNATLSHGAPSDDFQIKYTLEKPDDTTRTSTVNVSEGTRDVTTVTWSGLDALDDNEDERFTLTAEAEGYDEDMAEDIYVYPGESEEAGVFLEAQDVNAEVDVELQPGAPSENFEVDLELTGPEDSGSTSLVVQENSTSAGTHTFDNKAPLEIADDETYRLVVTAEDINGTEGYQEFNESRYIAPGDTEFFDVLLGAFVQIGDEYFLTIQEAVDAAEPGDTIDVAEGTFEEDVTMDTTEVTLNGTATDETTIVGNVTVEGDENTIQDLTIEGDYDDEGTDNELNNVVVTSSSPGGVVTLAGDGTTLNSVSAEQLNIEGTNISVQSSDVGTPHADGVVNFKDGSLFVDITDSEIVANTSAIVVRDGALNANDSDRRGVVDEVISSNDFDIQNSIDVSDDEVLFFDADELFIGAEDVRNDALVGMYEVESGGFGIDEAAVKRGPIDEMDGTSSDQTVESISVVHEGAFVDAPSITGAVEFRGLH